MSSLWPYHVSVLVILAAYIRYFLFLISDFLRIYAVFRAARGTKMAESLNACLAEAEPGSLLSRLSATSIRPEGTKRGGNLRRKEEALS